MVIPALAVVMLVSVGVVLLAENRPIRRPAKMTAATAFVAVALAAGAVDTAYGRWVLAALAASWIGDLALTWRGRVPFLTGLSAFLAAHVVYVIAFAVRSVDPLRVALELVPIAMIGGLALRWMWPHVGRGLRLPVTAYVAVISVMVAMAGGTFAATPDWRIRLGAVMFYISDLFVARDRFVAPGPSNARLGLPLYFGGQLLLAWSAGA